MAFGLKFRYAWVVVFFLTSYQLLVYHLLWRILVYTCGEKQLKNSMSNRTDETKFCMDCSFLDLPLFNHESRKGNLDQFSLTSLPVSPHLRNITNLWSSATKVGQSSKQWSCQLGQRRTRKPLMLLEMCRKRGEKTYIGWLVLKIIPLLFWF